MPFQVDMNFQHVQIVIAQDYKPGKFNWLKHCDGWRCRPCNTLRNTGVKYNILEWKS